MLSRSKYLLWELFGIYFVIISFKTLEKKNFYPIWDTADLMINISRLFLEQVYVIAEYVLWHPWKYMTCFKMHCVFSAKMVDGHCRENLYFFEDFLGSQNVVGVFCIFCLFFFKKKTPHLNHLSLINPCIVLHSLLFHTCFN